MRKRALGLAVAFIVGAFVVSASGAATTRGQKVSKIDVSTRAAVIHYLHSIHVSAKHVVIQRGLRNYAGAQCPGKGWTCASTKHTVVQIAKRGGQNRYACRTAKCAVVQLGSAFREPRVGLASKPKPPPPPPGNTATCIKTTGITQSCSITQPGSSGTNTAIVWMVTPKLTGLTQSASYTASITQGPASAVGSSNINVACVTQAVSIDGSTTSTSGSVTVKNDAHQSITIQQNSLTGSNNVRGAVNNSGVYGCDTASSSLTQTETLTSTVTGKGAITQLQDTTVTSPNVPNVLLDIEQNQGAGTLTDGSDAFKNNALATATNAASFVQTSHMTAIANTPKGPVTQQQSSPDDNPPFSGIVAAINQDTTGVSTASATQIETQCQDAATSGQKTCDTNDPDAPTAYTPTQTQYGPEGIYHSTRPTQGRVPFVHKTPGDSAQTGNPANAANSWGVTQSSTQDNDTNSGQKNTIAGGIASPGTGTTNQSALIQGSQTIDVQDNGSGTISCPTGKDSCTKTLSAPKITQQPADPSAYGSGLRFEFKNADPTVTFKCSLDGAAYGTCDHVTHPTITGPPYPPTTGYENTAGLKSGQHTFSVETVDPANPSTPGPASATITWVITPPDPSLTTSSEPNNPALFTDTGSFQWTDADSTTIFKCSLDGAAYSPCVSDGTGASWSGLSSGSHTFSVKAYDSTGTYVSTHDAHFSWWITPPDPTITSSAPPSPDFSGNSYSFTFTDTDTTVHYQCQIDSQTATACNTGTSPAYAALAPGSHTFTVTAYGANDSGFTHPDTAPATATWTILPLAVSALGGDGSSAGWACTPGGPIALTVGTTPYDPDTDVGTYAMIDLVGVAGLDLGTLAAPTFTSDNYGAGSPRYYIKLDNGDSLWGYPPAEISPDATDFGWVANNGNSYQSWSDVVSAEGGAKVTRAFVIADGSQAAGETDNISSLTFGTIDFEAAPSTCPSP